MLACILLLSLAAWSRADITSHVPASGTCVCATTTVNARSNHGTSYPVKATLSAGDCNKFHGGVLTADGHRWYEVTIGSENLWIAGEFLNIGTASQCAGGNGGGSCSDATAKALACELLQLKNSGKIGIWNQHPSGVSDQAYAITNIQDACNGHAVHRSGYKCSLCAQPAPGGTVCLSTKLLQYLVTLARKGYLHINEVAGACHHCNSAHYHGTAVDLHNGDGRNSEYLSLCKSMGGLGLDEGNHIHCNF